VCISKIYIRTTYLYYYSENKNSCHRHQRKLQVAGIPVFDVIYRGVEAEFHLFLTYALDAGVGQLHPTAVLHMEK